MVSRDKIGSWGLSEVDRLPLPDGSPAWSKARHVIGLTPQRFRFRVRGGWSLLRAATEPVHSVKAKRCLGADPYGDVAEGWRRMERALGLIWRVRESEPEDDG